MKRGNYVGSPAYHHLNNACMLINQAFRPMGAFCCYHVGSSLQTRDYRDVDIRMIIKDADYDRLFPNDGTETPYRSALWSLLCMTISDWLSKVSGLPVDFQIQRMTEANANYSSKDGHHRNAIGLFLAPEHGDAQPKPADDDVSA